jgi:hypothetical protein
MPGQAQTARQGCREEIVIGAAAVILLGVGVPFTSGKILAFW